MHTVVSAAHSCHSDAAVCANFPDLVPLRGVSYTERSPLVVVHRNML